MLNYSLETPWRVIFVAPNTSYLVDESDYHWLSGFNWIVDRSGYATRTTKSGAAKDDSWHMHRMILGLKVGDRKVADHKSGVVSDNRRANLRTCTRAENSRNQRLRSDNSSGFKGVQWMKSKGKWQAKICVNRVQKHLGLFETAELAHAAYCVAATALHGEFANFGIKQQRQEICDSGVVNPKRAA